MENLMLSTKVLITQRNGEKIQGKAIFFLEQFPEKFDLQKHSELLKENFKIFLSGTLETLLLTTALPHILDENDELIENFEDVEYEDILDVNETNTKLFWE